MEVREEGMEVQEETVMSLPSRIDTRVILSIHEKSVS